MPNEPEFASDEWCDRLIDNLPDLVEAEVDDRAWERALIRAAIEETRKHDAAANKAELDKAMDDLARISDISMKILAALKEGEG